MAHLLLAVVAKGTGDTDDEQHQQREGCTIVHGIAQHDVLLDDGSKETDIIHRQQL